MMARNETIPTRPYNELARGKLPAQILIVYTLEIGNWHDKNLQELFGALVTEYGAKAACAMLGRADTDHWIATGECRYIEPQTQTV